MNDAVKFNGKIRYLVLLVYVLAGVAVYFSSLQAPFYLDDKGNITDNASIRVHELSFDEMAGVQDGARHNLRPVVYLSFALNYYFHGFDLFGYHLVNILIHFAAGVFLSLFLKTTFSVQGERHDAEQSPSRGR